jgi:hypothetical protein
MTQGWAKYNLQTHSDSTHISACNHIQINDFNRIKFLKLRWKNIIWGPYNIIVVVVIVVVVIIIIIIIILILILIY